MRPLEWQKTPGGGGAGSGRGSQVAKGNQHPQSGRGARWYKISGGTNKGEGVMGGGGGGQGGDGNPPTIRETEALRSSSGDEGMTCGLRPAALPNPERGTAVDRKAWRLSTGILTAPTAPGPITARQRAVSTAY